MWKWKEDDKPAVASPQEPLPGAAGVPVSTAGQAVSSQEVHSVEVAKPLDSFRAEIAHIGKSVVIRGELSGSEDLYVDGEVEGSIELHGHNLTIGPNGRVRASVHARDIVVHGKVEGKVHGLERVELRKSAILIGDITTYRIVIEDGAYLKGGVDIEKQAKEPPAEPKHEAAAAAQAVTATQGLLLEAKK